MKTDTLREQMFFQIFILCRWLPNSFYDVLLTSFGSPFLYGGVSRCWDDVCIQSMQGRGGRSRIGQREKSAKVQAQQSLCQCQEGSLKNRWTFRVSLVASAVMQVHGRKSRVLHLSSKCFQDKKKKKEWRKNSVKNYSDKIVSNVYVTGMVQSTINALTHLKLAIALWNGHRYLHLTS